MSFNSLSDNSVDESGPSRERLSLGRGSVRTQADLGRHPVTAQGKPRQRKVWSQEENKILMECYLRSQPDIRGYRKRMVEVWNSRGMFSVSEQRLADQVRQIKEKGWLTTIEIEELSRKIALGSNEEREVVESETQESQFINTVLVEEEVIEVPEAEMTVDEREIVRRIEEIMLESDRRRLPALKGVGKRKIQIEVKKVDSVLKKIESENITSTNSLVYAGAVVVTERLGVKLKLKEDVREPMWKRRLEGQIKQLRRDLARVEQLVEGKMLKRKFLDVLQRKYWLKQKGTKIVREELKQRIRAKSSKVKRYQNRITQFRQNRLFQTDQGRFYQELNGVKGDSVAPDSEESKKFWSEIWSQPGKHRKDAEWLRRLKDEVKVEKQHKVAINLGKLRKVLSKMPNWKAPGPDLVQGFWLKNFVSLHWRLADQLDRCLSEGSVPEWMTKGRTVLFMKDVLKGNIASNYRPITCLPLVWKLLTGMISDEMYSFLEESNLLPEEQKGCRKGSRGTNDLLFIDKMVLREVKSRKKNLAMAWIDYRKAYDMVPHSWIVECLQLFGIADNIRDLLVNSMKKWRTELTSCSEVLGEVNIRRGIFQGDSLSPLLFVVALIPLTLVLRKAKSSYELSNREKINHLLFMDDLKLFARSEKGLDSLVQTVRVFSDDIGMQFGIEKCAMLVMRRGKKVKSEGIALPNNEKIRSLDETEGYKYLGVLEADEVLHKDMKEKLRKEYYRRVRKVLQSKLSGGNVIKAVNTWAVSLLRYSAAFVDWTREDLRELDRKTRKVMNMNSALHPRDSVARLYLPRKEGGRGLMSVEDCVDQAVLGLDNYVSMSRERLLVAARRGDEVNSESVAEFKNRRKRERSVEIREKVLHGQYFRQTKDIASKETWTWLQRGALKKETEGLILAAQDQALRTNAIKCRIDKSQTNSVCRLCKKVDETVSHIVSGCEKLAQKEYKRRHDKVALALHWDLCRKHGFQCASKWYEHVPEGVLESAECKILWDFTIQTDHVIQARRPDIVVIDKKAGTCQVIDVAVPIDRRVVEKEQEKIDKYQDLAREIRRLWKVKTKVIPVVIGALGTVPKRLSGYLREIGISTKVELMQKSVLLGTSRILRQVLES